ncbi:MAG: 50S ribosomal protein L32 [Candidatus Marinimicrobia bacterium]|nr:50S ribosomal protein L32 [Candidatus Neomarinimicrobiota bacterium]MBT5955799.1 50S ribosomal protein L32 [Candidatus Neomarinimicrobiota bacterium]MBT6870928.1 50S ribosomal protein L32 [Candidatus Neomarinimicrobiota bacterium]MBT7377717.1 50S ribosomal protein L32 [Candidatus Neomarinimicrobiota bacterium]
MAVPKRRHSKQRSRKRRTHWKCASPQTAKCSQCNHQKLPYRACANCGYYKGTPVISAQGV